ncbi:MAG: hypothetical protein IPQ07_06820 [Myxococcales bacterium]|nr:hypothetical protein [Myxococcales bacterium]
MTNAKLGRSLLIGVLSATTGAGCDVWNAPKRVTELEARVDDLSAAVSALSGKPVGGPTKHEDHEGAATTAKAHDGSGAEGSNGADPDAPPMAKPKDEHAKAEPTDADQG